VGNVTNKERFCRGDEKRNERAPLMKKRVPSQEEKIIRGQGGGASFQGNAGALEHQQGSPGRQKASLGGHKTRGGSRKLGCGDKGSRGVSNGENERKRERGGTGGGGKEKSAEAIFSQPRNLPGGGHRMKRGSLGLEGPRNGSDDERKPGGERGRRFRTKKSCQKTYVEWGGAKRRKSRLHSGL